MASHDLANLFNELVDKLGRNKRLLRAAARLAPFVGASIAEFISTGEKEEIISAIRGITEEQTERVLEQIQILLHEEEQSCLAPIAIVGSGNLEMLLHSPSCDSITLGAKHSVKVDDLWGGSGVNFAARLLSVGRVVLPVLTIADDHAGRQIMDSLGFMADKGGIKNETQALWSKMNLFNGAVQTPTSVLIIHQGERTVFRQQIETSVEYVTQLESQIDHMYSICDAPSTLLIGHVPRGLESPESIASVVQYAIEKYRNRTLIYSVFGSSQLRLGWKYWEKQIADNIDIFQLNLSEAKRFFSDSDQPATIHTVLDCLRRMRVSAVLTMDKFGALAIHAESDDIYVAWPIVDANDVIDSTGAGDAFAAGMVSVLSDIGPAFTTHDFVHALVEASRWAGAACTTIGGAGCEPGKELASFVQNNANCKRNNVETRRPFNVQELLTFIDLAFNRERN